MTPGKKTLSVLTLAGAVAVGALALSRPHSPRAEVGIDKPKPVVRARRAQLAILLDTSGSMEGLIDQTRTQLWKVVNDLAGARGSQDLRLEIALYEYGNSRIPLEQGYIRRVSPFTVELDQVSEAMFSLTTDGGDEYAGQVIDTAVRDLDWSSNPDDLKIIFIAGNEAFTQGPVDFRAAVGRATEAGINVSTIFCGGQEDPVASDWRIGSVIGHGHFATIDHNRAIAHIAAPQDEEIARLGALLNQTYIPFGALGHDNAARQVAQDNNAAASEGAMVYRSVSKASALYANPSWDLVDAMSAGAVGDLSAVVEGELPEVMRGMSLEQRKAYVAEQQSKRSELQSRIQELSRARAEFVAAKSDASEDRLDNALISAVREQAQTKGLRFE